MKKFAIFAWCLVFLAAAAASYGLLVRNKAAPVQVASVGGPFELKTHTGKAIKYDDLLGRKHVAFFGFTHCPEICPSTLFDVTGWLNGLGNDVENLDAYFFTVDPQRDTQEVLSEYVSSFHPNIVGITGSDEAMREAIKAYKVYAQRVDLDDGDYTMDHSASIMLFDENGGFSGTISYGENDETALAKLRRLIEG
ncbi:MAG: SCO family protein [Pseudomonadota bacterium]